MSNISRRQKQAGYMLRSTVKLLYICAAPHAIAYRISTSSPSVLKRSYNYRGRALLSRSFNDTDDQAISVFGTRLYWDEVYSGRGDFPADCYSWYYGWDVLGKHIKQYVPRQNKPHIFLPGIGNDPIIQHLRQAGYQRLTAMDYSEPAIERQRELLGWVDSSLETGRDQHDSNLELLVGDVRQLPKEWCHRFDAIVEKGLLDAVYLSGADAHMKSTVDELHRVLRPGGILISVSGVVSEDLRRHLFRDWVWLRDGSNDLQAGCFVFTSMALAESES